MNHHERVACVVAHMLRTAQPGAEVESQMVRGPETEETTRWIMTVSGDVEVWHDSLYPAMYQVPAVLARTLTREQAHDELVAAIEAHGESYVAYLEEKWGLTT